MQNINNHFGIKKVLYLILTFGFLTAVSQPFNNSKKNTPDEIKTLVAAKSEINPPRVISGETEENKKREKESAQAFIKAYRVFMHPRCMNCHPVGDAPLQGDDSHIHAQNVTRGPDGKGLYAMKCSNCHQPQHVPGENMPPGHALWHLPPANRKMVFEGKSPAQLAAHFKDNNFTGFKDFKKEMLHHVEHEPLVLNSWTYGTPPPLSHEEFVAAVKEWIDKERLYRSKIKYNSFRLRWSSQTVNHLCCVLRRANGLYCFYPIHQKPINAHYNQAGKIPEQFLIF